MGGRLASPRARRAALAAGLLGWAALCFFCSQGTPPGVDLPAHAAQIRTLAGLLRGEPDLAERFSAHLVPGYGLVTWAMAPVAMFRDGLVATRFALFLSMAGLLPALAAVCAGAAVLASRWRLALAAACVVVALVQVVTFHLRFQRSVAGVLSVSREERTRGYLSILGPTLPWTRLPYLTHLGQWVTARKGGIGSGFFTDAASQPVQLRPDLLPPLDPEALYVFGEGPLPAGNDRWCLERAAFELRRYDHRCLDAETAERDVPERRPAP